MKNFDNTRDIVGASDPSCRMMAFVLIYSLTTFGLVISVLVRLV